jgi:hypothetical protein
MLCTNKFGGTKLKKITHGRYTNKTGFNATVLDHPDCRKKSLLRYMPSASQRSSLYGSTPKLQKSDDLHFRLSGGKYSQRQTSNNGPPLDIYGHERKSKNARRGRYKRCRGENSPAFEMRYGESPR